MGFGVTRKGKKKNTNFFTNRSSKSLSKLALISMGLLICAILLGKGVQFFKALHSPFSEDLLVKKKYTWDHKTSVNIAFKYNGVSILNYDPNLKKIVILNIPDDTYLDLPKGFGYWRVGSIYSLGQEEKKPVGAELLKQSLAKLIGLPVDGFIAIDQKSDEHSSLSDKSLVSLISGLHNNPFKTAMFIKDIQTDFTPLETFELIGAISEVRGDKIATLDLGQSNITDSELLPDSSRVLGVDSIRMDLFIRDEMSDSAILSEQAQIAIFNATSHPGLAADAARVVTNMGGNVILTSNTEKNLDKSIVIGDKTLLTTSRLMQIFAPSCAKVVCKSDDYRVASSRAQINIVIGEDYYNDHYQRN